MNFAAVNKLVHGLSAREWSKWHVRHDGEFEVVVSSVQKACDMLDFFEHRRSAYPQIMDLVHTLRVGVREGHSTPASYARESVLDVIKSLGFLCPSTRSLIIFLDPDVVMDPTLKLRSLEFPCLRIINYEGGFACATLDVSSLSGLTRVTADCFVLLPGHGVPFLETVGLVPGYPSRECLGGVVGCWGVSGWGLGGVVGCWGV